MKIDEKEIIKDFLSNFPGKGTAAGYKSQLKKFFKVINKDPDHYIKDVRVMENGERIKTLDQYEDDVKKFWKWLISQNYAPKSVYNGINCVRVFLKQYRIKLDEVIWENFNRRGPGNKPATIDKPITKEILQRILTHAGPKERSVFLILASSGMRIGEIVQLLPEDINTENKPTKIQIRHSGTGNRSTKGKYSRYAFITPEATLALEEWLKVRNKNHEISVKRTNLPNVTMNPDDERVFPWHQLNINKMWNKLLEKADSEKLKLTACDDTGLKGKPRKVYHPHGLRKYFRTYFGRYNRDLADFLMGHKHYLAEQYVRMEEKEVRTLYKDGMRNLLIYETSVDTERVDNLEEQLAKKEEALSKLNKQVSHLLHGFDGCYYKDGKSIPIYETEAWQLQLKRIMREHYEGKQYVPE